MKKFLLIIGLSIFSFSVFAEKVPAVIVNKTQGGLTAILNLYNYVIYTPASLTSTGCAQLDCSGSGFSACRVPNCSSMPVNTGISVVNIDDAGILLSFKNAINDVILQYETALEQYNQAISTSGLPKGVSLPTVYTKTIAMAGSSGTFGKKSKVDTYVIRGVVTANTSNSSTMKIYIEKVDFNNLIAQ